jgi:hypothetical protein
VPTQFEFGYLVGLLVGEGHFGGDGRQPQVSLRMHVRHEALFRWLERTFPGGRLYGPYHHAGRSYFQWMARGRFLRDELVPVLDRYLSPGLDRHSFDRYQLMKTHYPQLLGNLAVSGRGHGHRAHGHAASTPSVSAGVADDHKGTGSRSASSAASERNPATFTDLFTELRKNWSPG